jgi:predicted HTH domain antitoxin
MQLTLDIPEKYFIFQSPAALARLLKLNTAIDLYRQGRFSASAAAEFVGDLDRYEFLYECRQRGIEPQTYESTDELQAEIDMLARELA